MNVSKPIQSIPIDELEKGQVWEYDLNNESGQDETYIYPITSLPVNSLENREVVTKITSNNGRNFSAVIGNITLNSAEKTREFMTVSIVQNNGWFHLARYYDMNYQGNGPEALAGFFSMNVDEVFPISYDISNVAIGVDEVLKNRILKEPQKRLTDEERMVLIFS